MGFFSGNEDICIAANEMSLFYIYLIFHQKT